jgi:DNA polymerase zeta
MLCRLSKRLDYVLLSASRFQLKKQIPNQMIPLVMEPPKCFYFSPVVVLDFQSLYPSIMIAYNICYSTCLGKIVNSLEEFNDEYKENNIFKK